VAGARTWILDQLDAERSRWMLWLPVDGAGHRRLLRAAERARAVAGAGVGGRPIATSPRQLTDRAPGPESYRRTMTAC
jgi:hypothetical protein